MIRYEEFWERVQRQWDRRIDPLDDPEVKAFLLENADALEEFASLNSRLELLGESPPEIATGRRSVSRLGLRWIIAAGVVAVGLLLLPEGDTESNPTESVSHINRVEDYSIEVVVRRPGETHEESVSRNGWSRSAARRIPAAENRTGHEEAFILVRSSGPRKSKGSAWK